MIAFKQLGNSVNVEVVRKIASRFLQLSLIKNIEEVNEGYNLESNILKLTKHPDFAE